MLKHSSLVSIVVFAIAGCVDDGSDDASATDDTADDIVRTRVVLQPDGRDPIVTTDHITRAEHEAELAARDAIAKGERPLVSVDNDCSGASMWIFDNTGNVVGAPPFNHEICFLRNNVSGCVDLRNYIRSCTYFPSPPYWSCSYWGTNTRSWIQSFYSGIDEGWFAGLYEGYANVMTPFGYLDRQDYAAVSNTHPGVDPSGVAWAQFLCLYP